MAQLLDLPRREAGSMVEREVNIRGSLLLPSIYVV